MNHFRSRGLCASVAIVGVFLASCARAEVKTTVDHNDAGRAKAEFKFEHVPSPSKADAGQKAKFSIVDGERDPAGAELDVLHDGKLPTENDQPEANFFFNVATEGGRIGVDLGDAIDVKQINTYSWHTDSRAPQVYKLYASDGKGVVFKAAPKKDVDPKTCGWTLVATVDTRPKDGGDVGGQYGVSTADSDANKPLGHYRYVLIDASQTEETDGFGNTFYSEIDVVGMNDPVAAKELLGPAGAHAGSLVVVTGGGKYHITIETGESPELTDWAATDLAPVVKEWYPKLVDLLPSQGYDAPHDYAITFTPKYDGVAYTLGSHVVCSSTYFDKHRPDVGAVVHEMVHVVQQYGLARRNPKAGKNPGWLVEGLADCVRWYGYEPQAHGADITKRGLARAKYDAGYRNSANFLKFVSDKYDKDLVVELNTAMRTGNYSEDLWKKYTGKELSVLADEWKADLEKTLNAAG